MRSEHMHATIAAMLLQCGGELLITDEVVRKIANGHWEIEIALGHDKTYTYRLRKINDARQLDLIPVNQTDEE